MSSVGIAIGGNVILFVLICCMSGTVEFDRFRTQARNRVAVGTGVLLQFVVLPFLGFSVVKAFSMDDLMGISLLIITSSPGGSYSNLFCSLFNGDLALSVTMTAISTVLAIGMLPLNLYIYANAAYGNDIVSELNWVGLSISLAVVISAILLGLAISWKAGTTRVRQVVNRIGSVAGITLILYSSFAPEGETVPLTGKSATFYCGVAAPIVVGMVLSTIIATVAGLEKPERVAVTVECCYQNTSIAISIALTIYTGFDQLEALAVSFYYTGLQTIILAIYCLVAWKVGWTKAPRNENFFKMLFNSYEVAGDGDDDDGNKDNIGRIEHDGDLALTDGSSNGKDGNNNNNSILQLENGHALEKAADTNYDWDSNKEQSPRKAPIHDYPDSEQPSNYESAMDFVEMTDAQMDVFNDDGRNKPGDTQQSRKA